MNELSPSARRPVRVAHVLGTLEPGGMQTLVLDLMRTLDRRRFDPILVHFKTTNHFEEEIRSRGWTCRRTPMSRQYRPRDVRRLAALLAEESVELIHTHADLANFAGRAAALLLPHRVPIVAHYHGHYFHHLDATFRKREALLSPFTDRIVACSASVETLLLETLNLPSGRVRRIVNGLALDAFEAAAAKRDEARRRYEIPDNTFHIIHTGRLEPHKAPERLLRALCRLGIDSRPWRATFVGGGGQAASLERLTATLRIEGETQSANDGGPPLSSRVEFAGWSSEMPERLASADAFVLCSKHEGLPLSVVEALATGTPVVGADIPGVREVIEDGVSGLIVETQDPRQLAEALRRLMDDAALRDRLREGGRRRAKAFSLERFRREIESLYEETLAAPPPAPAPPRGIVGRWRFLRSIQRP